MANYILKWNVTGQFEESTEAADVDAVVQEIEAALAEAQDRQKRLRGAQGLY